MSSHDSNHKSSDPPDEPSGGVSTNLPSDEAIISRSDDGVGASYSSRPDGPSSHSSRSGLPITDTQETVISKRPPEPPPMAPVMASPMEMGATLVGMTLGHFRLEEFIGGGGMGAVFRATDVELGRIVAVKVLSRDHSDEEILRRFKNEAQSAARLDHDNIARVHYVGIDKGLNYIVFEYIEGKNIRELVAQKGPLPLAEAINYTLQVAEALEHASRRDVVHRDIKPSNVLITNDGHVKLVDMGLARLHQVDSSENDLTASGVTLGTFDYISPEQARDPRNADVRSDIYSLGCTLYFMITGRAPFPEGTVLQKLLSHTSDERPDPRLYRPDLPEEVTAIVNKMLARQPHERYQQPNELIGELLLLVDQLGLQGAGNGGTVWITPRSSEPRLIERLMPVVLPAALLMIGVFALDYFWPSDDGVANVPAARNFEEVETPVVPPTVAATEVKQPNGTNSATQQSTDTSASHTPQPSDSVKGSGEPTAVADTGTVNSKPPQDTVSPPSPMPPAIVIGDTNPVADLVKELLPLDGAGPPSIEVELTAASLKTAGPLGLSTGNGESQRIGTAEMPTTPNDPIIEPVPVKARILIVGRAEDQVPADARLVESLEAACKLAAESAEVEAIELRYSGPREERPFTLTGKAAAKELTIRAGEGYQPIIVFKPQQRDFVSDGHMINLVGGQFRWQGLHFRFELPDELSDDWALFRLNQVVSVDVRRSTLTIVNQAPDGSLRQNKVAFFSIQRPPKPEMMMGDPGAAAMALTPAITLGRCVVRGEATLVRAEEATPFALKWVEGLLVTSEWLLQMGGTAVEPEWDGKVEVSLQHVTAMMGNGMCFVSSDDKSPFQLPLYINCQHCILKPGPYAALIEHYGVDSSTDRSKLLDFRGDTNFFPGKNVLWKIVPSGGLSQVAELYIKDAELEGIWYSQRHPTDLEKIQWQGLPSVDRPAHRQATKDYLLIDDDANPPSRLDSGFHPDELPDMPETSSPPATQPTYSETMDVSQRGS